MIIVLLKYFTCRVVNNDVSVKYPLALNLALTNAFFSFFSAMVRTNICIYYVQSWYFKLLSCQLRWKGINKNEAHFSNAEIDVFW